MDDFKIFKEKYELKEQYKDDDDGGNKSGVSAGDFKKVEFLANNVKAEIDYLKKQFNPAKISQIDKQQAKLESIGFEIEVAKMNMA